MTKANKKPKAEVLAKDLMTYSVRFTDAERDLLARAATLKGWSPTNLIRQVALESSAAIVNTAEQPAIKGLALKLAENAAKPRYYSVKVWDDDDKEFVTVRLDEVQLEDFRYLPGVGGVVPETPQLTTEEKLQIASAAKHGGTEFLRPFVDYTECVTAPQELDLTKLVKGTASE